MHYLQGEETKSLVRKQPEKMRKFSPLFKAFSKDLRMGQSLVGMLGASSCSLKPAADQSKRSKMPFLAGAGTIFAFGTKSVMCEQASEVLVGSVSDFIDGGMKEVSLQSDGRKMLVHRRGDKWYATGAKCSHYNYDLAKGISSKFEVVCPLHDAAFDIRSGCPSRGPGLDGIPTYKVSVRDDKVYVTVPAGEAVNRVPPPFTPRDPKNLTTHVIVGGGPAALGAAESMRQNGFSGRILIISAEPIPPYDRILLSKKFRVPGSSPNDILLRPNDWFNEHGIELKLDTLVKTLDRENRRVQLNTGEWINADKVLIATGASARQPTIPGSQLGNVFTLRSASDAEKFSVAFSGERKKVVVIGAGFIGIEAAALAASKGADVTILSTGQVPFERVFGRRVGAYFAQFLKENKVNFKGGCKAKLLRGRDGTVGGNGNVSVVELEGGDMLQADVVLFAGGAVPNTNWLVGSGVPLAADGGILVDPFMRVREAETIPAESSNRNWLYAAGDLAKFPSSLTGTDMRVEHWVVATDLGRVAGKNMAGGWTVYTEIPFFWTMVFGKSLRWVGATSSEGGDEAGWERVVIEGDLAGGKFAAYYISKDKVGAVATVGMDPLAVAVGEAIKRNLMPTASELLLGTANSQVILDRVNKA